MCQNLDRQSRKGGVFELKIGIFTDAHYSSKEVSCTRRFNNQSLRKIQEAYEYFERGLCDAVICLGDLIDTEDTVEKEIENLSLIAQVIKKSPLKTICLMGNHDAFVLPPHKFYSILGTEPPHSISIEGRSLIFLDACYFKSGEHYSPGDSDWKDTYYPFADELKKELESLSSPTYVFIHQNLDPEIEENHRLSNSKEILDVIEQSGIVKAVFQGHYHPGKESVHNGIRYLTLPAMCENETAYWVLEL